MACAASVFIATSLDGFIAKKDGSVDWLNDFQASLEEGGEDGGFAEFLASVDALAMGRKTFETVRDMPDAPWPYGDTPVWVLSNGKVDVPERLASKVHLTKGTPEEILKALAAAGVKDVYVDGGEAIRGFVAAGAVTRVILTKIPLTLGEGIPLFTEEQKSKLKEVSSKTLRGGMVQTTYTI
mmetsp:Transcript_55511/g.130324  ORF Transcript_55511/g.130324 Transcript_55511/m.130324 type:complete len:182 (+) Transcript_55511:48-593(+)